MKLFVAGVTFDGAGAIRGFLTPDQQAEKSKHQIKVILALIPKIMTDLPGPAGLNDIIIIVLPNVVNRESHSY